ncbi:hypothetical protein LR48_Vigan10g256400 [Vigna angularis]|uniref:beta-galactosidase n=1 Tax=Phaseolus angularis TaxID=3914 RepID=A0A0L9VP42_PHAAN|nr:hypothetical protein LR48_Vigan10g256400 [Vigna angularis]
MLTQWFKNWGGKDPHRTAEDVAYSVARFFQTGGTFQNYYMYHGGTNFGRTAGGPYITTTYDYDAPLDEFGNIAQPKWGHLKELHKILKSMENSLTNYGNVSEVDLGHSVKATMYMANDSSSCFLTNTNTTTDAIVTFRGNKYNVPAWSVSLLPDCQTEEYNTAKVNVQTSVMIKGKNKAEDEPIALNWVWRAENIDDALLAKEHESENGAEKWITNALSFMRSSCPTSLKIFLKSGTRAKLFDKDNKPKWEPSKLELVDEETVNEYFRSINDNDGSTKWLPHDIPKPVWRYPMSYISFHFWALQGQYQNDLRGLIFDNQTPELPKIPGEYILEKVFQIDVNRSKWINLSVIFSMIVIYRIIFFIMIKINEDVTPWVRGYMARRRMQQKSGAQNTTIAPDVLTQSPSLRTYVSPPTK